MQINFVREMLAFQDYAAREELTANEVVLFLAIFRCHNDAYWPEGALAITNNALLARTTFCGSKRDDTLRETRKRLAERGLITFTPGEAYKARPTYAICWEELHRGEPENSALEDEPETAPEDAPEDTPEDAPKNRGVSGGYIYENENVKQAHPCTVETERHTQTARAREGGYGPRAGEYTDLHGNARPCRYDGAWAVSGRARCAVAARLITQAEAAGWDMNCARLLDGLCELMGCGMPPELIEDAIRGPATTARRLLAQLRAIAYQRGYTEEAAQRRGASPTLLRVLDWRDRVQEAAQ